MSLQGFSPFGQLDRRNITRDEASSATVPRLRATAPHGLKLRPPRYKELFTNAEEGREEMIVFDARSGAVLRTFPPPHGVHNFVFDTDGTALFAYNEK
jgi:hypothetical protein